MKLPKEEKKANLSATIPTAGFTRFKYIETDAQKINNPANKKFKQYQKLQTNHHIEHLVLTDTNITPIHPSKMSVMLNFKSSYKTLT